MMEGLNKSEDVSKHLEFRKGNQKGNHFENRQHNEGQQLKITRTINESGKAHVFKTLQITPKREFKHIL